MTQQFWYMGLSQSLMCVIHFFFSFPPPNSWMINSRPFLSNCPPLNHLPPPQAHAHAHTRTLTHTLIQSSLKRRRQQARYCRKLEKNILTFHISPYSQTSTESTTSYTNTSVFKSSTRPPLSAYLCLRAVSVRHINPCRCPQL